MRRNIFFLLLILVVALNIQAQTSRVKITTDKGAFIVVLYDDTPIHRDNFLHLVQDGYYNGILWHRVIRNFMIQTGDSTSRHARPEALFGEEDVPYTLPAEIIYPAHYHHRGALAAARESDDINPERRSSGAQFYVVTGAKVPSSRMTDIRAYVSRMTHNEVRIPHALAEDYAVRGGAPHLDGQYTVFGEVVEGMDVVEAISVVPTDRNDRPRQDIRIITAEIME